VIYKRILVPVDGSPTSVAGLKEAVKLAKSLRAKLCLLHVVDEMIVAYSREAGIARRKIGDEEIVQRCVFALVNEGALILEEGIAQRASDIDLVYLAGYGFPPFRGGPMFHADTVGLFNVVRAMERFAKNPRADPEFWKPAPLLKCLAAEGKTFNAA